MMEVNITHLINRDDLHLFTDSIANSGLENIAEITWKNACEFSEESPLVDDQDGIDLLIDWLADFGAWTREELLEYSDTELNALLLQFVAGDIREFQEEYESDLEAYQAACEAGETNGRLTFWNNEWHFQVGM